MTYLTVPDALPLLHCLVCAYDALMMHIHSLAVPFTTDIHTLFVMPSRYTPNVGTRLGSIVDQHVIKQRSSHNCPLVLFVQHTAAAYNAMQTDPLYSFGEQRYQCAPPLCYVIIR